MPRLCRFAAPGQPQHVIQRGNNKTAIFMRPADYRAYYDFLQDAALRFECEVHAYVFMPNHVHLLMSPRSVGGIGRTMQSIGRRYVQRFNGIYARTGTLWEGRYRATVIDTERYLFTCHRYIELNPVRAGLSMSPWDYPWSSHAANALGVSDELVTPHALYLGLGSSHTSRQASYRHLFRGAIDGQAFDAIRDATNKAWILGDERSLRCVTQLGRRATPLRRMRTGKQ